MKKRWRIKRCRRGSSVEKLLALHCAPALAGVKAVEPLHPPLFGGGSPRRGSCAKRRTDCAPAGVRMEILCECERYALVFVYREELLAAAIGPEAEDFLAGCGYRHGLTLAEENRAASLEARQMRRVPARDRNFPRLSRRGRARLHCERGQETSRPAARGRSTATGERAAGLFESYRRCTEYFCSMVERGARIVQLCGALRRPRAIKDTLLPLRRG